MARYKDYIQDEDRPFGTGTFELDDGSSYYLDDPERARSVLEELYGAQDPSKSIMAESTKIAETGELDTREKYENAVAKLAGVPGPNQPGQRIDRGQDPMRRAVAGPGGGEPLESREPDRGESQSRVPDGELQSVDPGDEPQAGRVAPPTEEQLRSERAGQRLTNAMALTPRTTGGTDPRLLGPGVNVDQSYSRKGGMAPDEYERQRQTRQNSYNATNEGIARHYREDQAARDAELAGVEAQIIEQRKQNAAAELDFKRKEQKYADDRAWLEKDVDTFYDTAKPDGSRWFKDGGAFRQIGTAIAQFMGAYASIVSGAPNFANQIIDKKIERDIDDQIQAFRMGKMKRDGQLQRMAERGMSVEQMRSALRLQQEMVVQKEIKAAALRDGSREARQAAESVLLNRQEKFTAEENKFRTEALGEETVNGNVVRPTAPRAKTQLEILQDTYKLLEAGNKVENEARGGAAAERAEERQYQREKDAQDRADRRETNTAKTTEDQAKAEAAWATIQAYGDAVGIKQDPKTGERVADQGLFSKDTLLAPGQREELNDLTGQGKPIEAARRAAVEGLGRLQSGGVISPAEEENFKRLLGDAHATRAQIATNINALDKLIRSRRSPARQQESAAAPYRRIEDPR